jgi:hypothetical protein
MMSREHPDENVVATVVGGHATAAEVDEIERHLDGCQDCLDVVAFAARAIEQAEPMAAPGGT